MFLLDLAFALIVAMAFAVVLVGVFRWRHPARSGPWAAFLFLFGVLFLAVWAGGVWLTPGSLIAFGLTGLLVALLVVALAPARFPRSRRRDVLEASNEGTVFGLYFWFLLSALLLAVILGYAI